MKIAANPSQGDSPYDSGPQGCVRHRVGIEVTTPGSLAPWGLGTQSQALLEVMGLEVHSLVQDAYDLDSVGRRAIEEHVRA